MARFWHSAVCFLFLAAGAPIGAAQSIQARFTAGMTSWVDDGAFNHATVGGSARFYFARRWSVEPEYLYMHHSSHHDHLLWGNVAFDIPVGNRKVVPYLFAAPGFIRTAGFFASGVVVPTFVSVKGPQVFPGTTTPIGGTLQPIPQFSGGTRSRGAISAGVGVNVFLSERVFVAPRVRLGTASGFFGEVTGSVGFVLRK